MEKVLPTGNIASATDSQVFLIGRPPLEEYLGFVSLMTEGGGNMNLGKLAAEWRAANDHVRILERDEAGIADNPDVKELPNELKPYAESVVADPVFQRSFEVLPTLFGTVELDRLVVFQKQINLAFVKILKEGLGPSPSQQDVFSFCLPVAPSLPPVRALRLAQNVYAFVSPSNDFRFLEPVLLDPGQVEGYRPPGRTTAILGLAIGYGSNYLSVLEVGNRLVLNNGSHRAYALRDLGITHAPVLIQRVSRRDELSVTGVRDLIENPDRFLDTARPPLLKDYFDPRLRKIVEVPRKVRQVRLSFGIEQSELPA